MITKFESYLIEYSWQNLHKTNEKLRIRFIAVINYHRLILYFKHFIKKNLQALHKCNAQRRALKMLQ